MWNDFRTLSAAVSVQQGINAKRAYIESRQSMIDDMIVDAIKNASPLEAFALLDGVKSLVGRELLLRNRTSPDGHTDIVFHGVHPKDVSYLIASDPGTCAISFYQSPDHDFWALMTYIDNGKIKAETILIASNDTGHEVYRQLVSLSRSQLWRIPAETEKTVVPLLFLFGNELIPRLERMREECRIILIPHKWLHLLPLHLMMARYGDTVVFLDLVASAVTYASSITCFEWGGKPRFRPFKNGQAEQSHLPKPDLKVLLACVDVDNLGAGAQMEIDNYTHTLYDSPEKRDIVTDASSIPIDMSPYLIFIWSSHGRSDPTSWKNSALQFGDRAFTAMNIIEEWNLSNALVGILSACETGVDYSIDGALDEYSGLDMALHIAGASSVLSTMWRVEDRLAAFVACSLFEGALQGHRPSEFLRLIRYMLITGRWYDMIEKNYSQDKVDISLPADKRARRMRNLEGWLSIPKDAFAHISSWGVFRCFGRW